MFSLTLLAVAPVAYAAQSTTWPAFVLRANVTQAYQGYGPPGNTGPYWHNAPLGNVYRGSDPGPAFDDSLCETTSRVGLQDPYPYTMPHLFFSAATSDDHSVSSSLLSSRNGIHIASADQLDSQGRRAVTSNNCGNASTSLYISQEEPYHLVYDNQDADEEFGSWYMCGPFSWGDGLFYRSAAEETPEECGEVTFYPECLPLQYTVTTTQGTSNVSVYHDAAGAYNARCYVNTEDVTGPPNNDVSYWFSAPRTSYQTIGKISLNETVSNGTAPSY